MQQDPLGAYRDQGFYWEARRLREGQASGWVSVEKLIVRLMLFPSRNSVNSGCSGVQPISR
jgi:hypothetical protein